jgi:predicted nucleic acid-binding protein
VPSRKVICLDSGPLGLACSNPKNPDVIKIGTWLRLWQVEENTIVILPEIIDYELRRELLLQGFGDSVSLLDQLRKALNYVLLRDNVLDRAAGLWADLRRRGLPTTHDHRLDVDVILAAQALDYTGHGDELIIATSDPGDLNRLGVITCYWDAYWPYHKA